MEQRLAVGTTIRKEIGAVLGFEFGNELESIQVLRIGTEVGLLCMELGIQRLTIKLSFAWKLCLD